MKLWATLAMVVALLAAPVSNAAADIFTLWQNFPEFTNGENGFGTAGVTHTDTLLTPLVYATPYSFSRDGVVVERSVTEPLILLQPSSTESAVFYGIPPQPYSIYVYGEFSLAYGASAHVDIGTALITDFSHPVYTSLFSYDLNSSHPTVSFDLPGILVDSTHALAFSADQGSGATQVYLSGTINDNVPIPGALLLFGSGLLGLAGWKKLGRNP